MLRTATDTNNAKSHQPGKIVITGGAGFIGSHLCDLYIEKGHEVICIDNLISGRENNIKHLMSNDSFTFLNHDIIESLPSTINDLSAIFHFASPASPNPESPVSYMSNPVETLMVNSIGTKNMLDLARKNNCQIILASTSEVYGDPQVHPQPESYFGNVSPNGPRSCYDESKRFLEAISFTYHREFNTKIKVVRIFNTYGPRMRFDDGRFIMNMIIAGVKGSPFKLFGNGSVTRSFCYIDDLVRGINSVFENSKMIGEVVNLGNPEELSVKQAMQLFEEIVNVTLSIKKAPALQDDPKRRNPDITKAKSLLGWEPTLSFKEGIKKMFEHYSESLS